MKGEAYRRRIVLKSSAHTTAHIVDGTWFVDPEGPGLWWVTTCTTPPGDIVHWQGVEIYIPGELPDDYPDVEEDE